MSLFFKEKSRKIRTEVNYPAAAAGSEGAAGH